MTAELQFWPSTPNQIVHVNPVCIESSVNRNLSRWKRSTRLTYIVNAIAANIIAQDRARASTGMVLTEKFHSTKENSRFDVPSSLKFDSVSVTHEMKISKRIENLWNYFICCITQTNHTSSKRCGLMNRYTLRLEASFLWRNQYIFAPVWHHLFLWPHALTKK